MAASGSSRSICIACSSGPTIDGREICQACHAALVWIVQRRPCVICLEEDCFESFGVCSTCESEFSNYEDADPKNRLPRAAGSSASPIKIHGVRASLKDPTAVSSDEATVAVAAANSGSNDRRERLLRADEQWHVIDLVDNDPAPSVEEPAYLYLQSPCLITEVKTVHQIVSERFAEAARLGEIEYIGSQTPPRRHSNNREMVDVLKSTSCAPLTQSQSDSSEL